MAITWELKIIPIDITNYIASIDAVRTDSLDLNNPMYYTIHRAKLKTGSQQIIAMDRIWAKHLAALSTNTVVDAFVTVKEIAGKANLEARE